MAASRAKTMTKSVLRRAGFELQRSDPQGSYAKRRQLLLEAQRVEMTIDVGAHAGEFGESLRHTGYRGEIVSFEPLAALYERLCETAAGDAAWSCRKLAIGGERGETEINISGNDGFSSSILEMGTAHEQAAPESVYVGKETVALTTLDHLREEILSDGEAFLKVDTQGYETQVLGGATELLTHCALVELELGLVELYRGQALFGDLLDWMEQRGFALTDLEPGFKDERTGQLLQVDALFLRKRGRD